MLVIHYLGFACLTMSDDVWRCLTPVQQLSSQRLQVIEALLSGTDIQK